MNVQTVPPLKLRSNSFALDMSAKRLGSLQPSDPHEPAADLRARFDAEGYLWLKRFLPQDEVLGFRWHFFAAFTDTGLLAQGSDPADGLYSGAEPDADLDRRRLMEVVRSAAYESFCLHPHLWRFMDAFVGGPSYLHKRKLIRYTKPSDASATGAHYDLTYLRGGTDRLVTAWIPIGDVPVAMGGLVYLEGSHAHGRTLEAEFARDHAHLPAAERIGAFNKTMNDGGWITKDLPALADRLDSRWLAAEYEAGDVVAAQPVHDPRRDLQRRQRRPPPPVDRYPLPERPRRDRRALGEPLVARRHAVTDAGRKPHIGPAAKAQ